MPTRARMRRRTVRSSAAKAKRTESTDYFLATTADQIAAQQIGQDTQLPSLELSMDLLSVVGRAPTTATPASIKTISPGRLPRRLCRPRPIPASCLRTCLAKRAARRIARHR